MQLRSRQSLKTVCFRISAATAVWPVELLFCASSVQSPLHFSSSSSLSTYERINPTQSAQHRSFPTFCSSRVTLSPQNDCIYFLQHFCIFFNSCVFLQSPYISQTYIYNALHVVLHVWNPYYIPFYICQDKFTS